MSCGIPIAPERELVITDLSVAEDEVRTHWTGGLDDPSDGAWHFGRLMAEMAPAGQDPETFVQEWLAAWGSDQTINGFVVRAKAHAIRDMVIDRWPRTPDGKLDLRFPPLLLAAIVNRFDLRNADARMAGEGRLVFAMSMDVGDHQQDMLFAGPAPARSRHAVVEACTVVGCRRLSPRMTTRATLRAMARVTGIGGVFFLATSGHKQLAAWYARHLGLSLEDWGGAILKWPDDKRDDGGLTVWHVAANDSDWFRPSGSPFMINYRVDDLDELLAQLRRDGVDIVKGPDQEENGKFAWIMDPDGNKIELWQAMAWDDKNKK